MGLWSWLTEIFSAKAVISFDQTGRTDAFDHDGDGKAGGSKPASKRGLDSLRLEAESLGIKVDRRWGHDTLQRKIKLKRK